MSISERIDKDIIKALKAGEKEKLTVLRGLKSDLKYKQISIGKDLTDAEVLEVLGTAAKKRRESTEQFAAGGRQDLVEKEKSELAFIKVYLPEQMGETEIRKIVKAAVEETGADSPQKMGLVMKVVMPKVKGRADGKMIQKLVTEILAN
ncbi:MAG: GatB/YqeY domain-containing protein [bacterium]|nr:GatB/YqeY domain-containing protein [bacterium]